MIQAMTIRPVDEEALNRARKALADAAAQRERMILRASKNGATLREIASAVGLSHQRVAQILSACEKKDRPHA